MLNPKSYDFEIAAGSDSCISPQQLDFSQAENLTNEREVTSDFFLGKIVGKSGAKIRSICHKL